MAGMSAASLRSRAPLLLAGVAGVTIWLTSGAAAAPNAAPADPVFSTRGQIAQLAASDTFVAALTTNIPQGNDRVVVWKAPGNQFVAYKTGTNSAAPATAIEFTSEIAIGAGRVAWIEDTGGNDLEFSLYAAPVGGGNKMNLDFVTNGDGAGGDIAGEWLGQLHGSGSALFYNRWSVCEADAADCADAGHIGNPKLLQLLYSGNGVPIVHGAAAMRLVAVGGPRLAFEPTTAQNDANSFADSGEVKLTTLSGKAIATVAAVSGDQPRTVALSATHLVVLRKHVLDVYNPDTAALTKAIPLNGKSAALKLAGANAKIAVLYGDYRLVLVRLADGKQVTFPLNGKSPVAATLNEQGLFYGYNVPTSSAQGRIVFETAAHLLARF